MAKIQEPRLIHWVALISLVIMWGSEYIGNEVALVAFSPLTITTSRVVLAAAGLYLFMRMRGFALPVDKRSWSFFMIMAIIGNAAPYFLISWGQVHIDSGLVGILMAVAPLSVLVLAHWLLPDEPMSGRRSVGFLVGLAGVVVLIGPDALLAVGGNVMAIIGQLAVLGAAICYGWAAVITRMAPDHPPVVTATGVMIAATIFLVPLWLIIEPLPDVESITSAATYSVLALGLISTALAAIVFFFLIAESGASFQSLINFLIPPWAVILGVVLLDEQLPPRAYAAMALVLFSLWLTRRGAADVAIAED